MRISSALFAFTLTTLLGGAVTGQLANAQSSSIVTCNSGNYERAFCPSNKPITHARIVSRSSSADCTFGSSWGFGPWEVWVDDGCRATFHLDHETGSEAPIIIEIPDDDDEVVVIEIPDDEDELVILEEDVDPYTSRGGRIFSCASEDYNRNYCATGEPIRHAKLYTKYSSSDCTLGRSWGFEGDRLWVDSGCRADFMVFHGRYSGGYSDNHPGGYYPPSQGSYGSHSGGEDLIECNPRTYGLYFCPVNRDIRDARVYTRHSGKECVLGQNWGYERRRLWVRDGCRAQFRVFYR